MKILTSTIDRSVNFVEQQLTGFIESRYVRRTDEYFIAYLSSQTGCNRGCRMCHLTATRQTQFTNCSISDFVGQLEMVFSHYDRDTPAKYMHMNWMARGEPLANPTLTDNGTELLLRLGQMAADRSLPVKMNISTIMPVTMRKSLVASFPMVYPTIYYSIYSIKTAFRNKWLPAAMEVDRALDMLAEYQQMTKKIIKFHGAFIKDENDAPQDVSEMMDAILKRNIVGEFNIVRYNPLDATQGQESDHIDQLAEIIRAYMPCKVIPRVGTDVYASCGTFIGDKR